MHPYNALSVERLQQVRLGDLVDIPEVGRLTARAKVLLDGLVGSLQGFVICGEAELIVGVPSREGEMPLLYSRSADPKQALLGLQRRYRGECGYWAPHQAANRGGIGTAHWAVGSKPGELEPVILLWRTPGELEVFAFDSYLDKLDVTQMSRDNERVELVTCLLYTSPSPRDATLSRMPSSA